MTRTAIMQLARRGALPRRVLVAGGAGFIGSHLCEALLAAGASVICVDSFQTGRPENVQHLVAHPGFELIRADICDPLPARVLASAVMNLACAASPLHYQANPVHTMLTSVLGTRNLLAFAADQGARFVQASTSEVYGDPEVHPQPESYLGKVNPTGPRACYDEGKRAAETLCFDYARAGRVDTRVARIFNTYGPRMRADDGRVVSNLITQALSGADITLYGDGSQTRSFCYVEDLVAGLLRLLTCATPLPGPINLGNPEEVSVAELARRVTAMTGSRSRITYRPLPPDDPHRRCPDISRARALLGWAPRVPLQEGLRRTIAWFAQSEHPAAEMRLNGEGWRASSSERRPRSGARAGA
jgi:UDP-glucuronate decarboxylase